MYAHIEAPPGEAPPGEVHPWGPLGCQRVYIYIHIHIYIYVCTHIEATPGEAPPGEITPPILGWQRMYILNYKSMKINKNQ